MSTKRRFKRKNVLSNKGEIIPQEMDENGNMVVTLGKNGVEETVPVAYLVAQSFLPNPDNKKFIRHKDGNKFNNHVDNLEWSDEEEK